MTLNFRISTLQDNFLKLVVLSTSLYNKFNREKKNDENIIIKIIYQIAF